MVCVRIPDTHLRPWTIEIDAIGTGRCFCTCVFDFEIEAGGVPSGIIPIRIDREVEPDGSELIFEAELDLSEGSGSMIIDTMDAGGICF